MAENDAGEKPQQEPPSDGPEARLTSLAAAIGALATDPATKRRGPAPVHLWHPAYCGEIPLRIAADGTWFYAGTPIQRAPMVALFAGILRKDPERYVLVTPVECVGIEVEDVPFVVVAMEDTGDTLRFVTSLGDEVNAGADHPLRFALDRDGGVKPYVHIRGGLEARLTRSLAIDLLNRAVERDGTIGILSGGIFFPIADGQGDAAA